MSSYLKTTYKFLIFDKSVPLEDIERELAYQLSQDEHMEVLSHSSTRHGMTILYKTYVVTPF